MPRRSWYTLVLSGAMMAPLLRKRSWLRWTMALAGGYALARELLDENRRESARVRPQAPVSATILSDRQAVFEAAGKPEMLGRMFVDAPWLEITESVPSEAITWHSLDADSPWRGRLSFRSAANDRGTIVEAEVEEGPARLRSRTYLRQSLRRLKQWIETGEIATIDGQPHGPRSPLGAALDALAELPSRPASPTSEPRPSSGAA